MITVYTCDGRITQAAKDHQYLTGADKIEIVEGKLVITYPGPVEIVELQKPFKSR